MAYNKAREEKKWRLWKEAEEKQLRSLGVSEDTIEQLRVHDWAIFNSDRRYYQRIVKTNGIRNWTEKPLTVINATISLTTELNGKELKSV